MKKKKENNIGRINLNLVNYKILNGNSNITCDNPGNLYDCLRNAFPEQAGYLGIVKVGEINRARVGNNGSTSYIYSGLRNTDINIPLKHEKDIKEKLESVGLTLEGRKCL